MAGATSDLDPGRNSENEFHDFQFCYGRGFGALVLGFLQFWVAKRIVSSLKC